MMDCLSRVASAKRLFLCLSMLNVVPAFGLAEDPVKPAPAGLACFGFPPKGWETIFNCMIYKLKWEELEPTPGQYEPGFRRIDETFRKATELGLSIRLVVVCGENSPAWLKAEVGTVTVHDTAGVAYNPSAAGGRTCARWWTTGFGEAYARMQRSLAARYDSHPALAVVDMTRCMSYWPEPFMRQLKEPQNRRNLREAGFSVALDKVAQGEALTTHAQYWKRTRSGIALNPYQELADSGDSWKPNMEYTAAFIQEAVKVLGARLNLQNDSFVSERSQLGPDYWKMFDLIRNSGASFGLQPRGTTKESIGDLRKLIEAAIGQGAGYLELVRIYEQSPISKAEFALYDKQLEANASRVARGVMRAP